MNSGKYIVLEGPEGVGKTTQIEELSRRLQAAGLPVRTLREPDSQSDLTARTIRQLTQDPRYPMNTNTEVLLYNAARSQSLQVIKNSVEQGVICLVDRNYLTTLAIQYYGRGDSPDYEAINRIISFAVKGVEPDLCIVLDAPVQTLQERAKFRDHGERFDDLDEAFLERVRAGYLWEAKQRNFPVVFATESKEEVSQAIWKLVIETLAVRQPSSALNGERMQSVGQIIAAKQGQSISHEPPLSAAAQATPTLSKNKHIISDSLHTLNLGNASKLLIELIMSVPDMKVELEQASDTDFEYYVPPAFNGQSAEQYRQKMDKLKQLRSELTQVLQTYTNEYAVDEDSMAKVMEATEAVLPIARGTKATIQAPESALKDLIEVLSTSDLAEAQTALQTIRAQVPTASFVVKTVKPADSLHEPVSDHPTYTATTDEDVILISATPRSELALIPEVLYGGADSAWRDLVARVESWSYNQKVTVLTQSLNDKLSARQLLRAAYYQWDIVADYQTFHKLVSSRAVFDIRRQPLSPRYGYETPGIIEQAGLSDQFTACFDLSLELYSLLQEAGYVDEAEYAVLYGHKLRYRLSCNAHDLLLLQEQFMSNDNLIDRLLEKVAEVHPLLAESLHSKESVDHLIIDAPTIKEVQ